MTEPIQTPTKPWWKHWWVIALAALLVIGVIGNLIPSDDDEKATDAPRTTTTAKVTTTTAPTTTTTTGAPKATDETCFAAFKAYSDAAVTESAARDAYADELANGNSGAVEPAALDEEPLQVATLTNCAGKVSWIVFAKRFQGTGPEDLFPNVAIGGEKGDDALRRVYASFCQEPSRKTLTACSNSYK